VLARVLLLTGVIYMTAQEEFDKLYVTSSEICRVAGISRLRVMVDKQRGKLPEPIEINGGQITVWRRVDVAPYLSACSARSGELA